MWLNGFHDNAPGYPRVECASMKCPQPYVSGVPGVVSSSMPPGPYGTGFSAPVDGHCPISKAWDNEEEIMWQLARHKLSAFEEASAGWMFWNFKVSRDAMANPHPSPAPEPEPEPEPEPYFQGGDAAAVVVGGRIRRRLVSGQRIARRPGVPQHLLERPVSAYGRWCWRRRRLAVVQCLSEHAGFVTRLLFNGAGLDNAAGGSHPTEGRPLGPHALQP